MQRMIWKSPLQNQRFRKTFKQLLLKLISDERVVPNKHSVYRKFSHQEIGLNSFISCSANKNSEI